MPKGPAGAEIGKLKEFTYTGQEAKKAAPKPDKIGRHGALGALIESTRGISDRIDLVNLVRRRGRIHRNTGSSPPLAEEQRSEAKPNTNFAARRKYKRIDTGLNGASSGPDNPALVSEPAKNTKSREDLQREHDETLADSVNPEKNKAAAGAKTAIPEEELPSDASLVESTDTTEASGEGEETTPDTETGQESKLISSETAGAQIILLVGESAAKSIDRKKLEAIANGEKPNAKEATKASIAERDEYWNGENSPHKKLSFKEHYSLWKKSTQEFIDRYKGKPEVEFFKRMGVDVEDAGAVDKIYKRFAGKGKGDVGLFAAELAKNNTSEQLRDNVALVQDWGLMYGVESSKVVTQMAIGIKNAQTDIDSFIKAAEGELKKGKDMSGMDLVTNLYKNLEKKMQKKPADKGATDVNNDGESELQQQEFRLNWDKRSASADTWTDSSGDLRIDGDVLSFTPNVNRLKNPYSPGTTEYDYFEKYQVRYFKPDQPSDFFIGEQRKRVERGVELAVNTGTDGESKMVLTPMFWEIIEANPESVSGRWADRYITLDQGENAVKSVRPVDLKIHNSEGKPRRIDLNFSWQKLKVDKHTLTAMQGATIEYIEGQVQAGRMPPEMLETVRGIIESHNAPAGEIARSGDGKTAKNPKVRHKLITFIERWQKNGEVLTQGDVLTYQDAHLRSSGDIRTIEIGVRDEANPQRKVLTRQAWDILKVVPKGFVKREFGEDVNYGPSDNVSDSLSRSKWDGKEYVRDVRVFTADTDTLRTMQAQIRSYVERQVLSGEMDQRVLTIVDGIMKFKHETLELVKFGSAGEGKVIYREKSVG